MDPLSDVVCKYFLPSAAGLFVFLNVSVADQVFIFIKSMNQALGVSSTGILLTPSHTGCLLNLLLEVLFFRFLCFASGPFELSCVRCDCESSLISACAHSINYNQRFISPTVWVAESSNSTGLG
jgi:hypothetical protein